MVIPAKDIFSLRSLPKRRYTPMGIVLAYTILALLLLVLSIGWYKPKKWNDLTDKHVKIFRFGCFFGFLVLVVNIVGRCI